ncbi:hypothetical protein JCM3765_005760 [Sporobolomyces pararoseus]
MSSSDSSSLSPSSALPSPSLRTSPFSVLPPELTQLIIEHTVPPTFHSETHKSRHSTLRSLCLVSKSFHHFARPLLFATLWIKRSTGLKYWKGIHADVDDKPLLRELVIDDIFRCSSSTLDLGAYVGLRTLVINESMSKLDLSTLSQIPQLSVLRLSYLDLSASTSFSLPNLYEMSLFQIHSISDQARFLNSSSLPSLRLLAYYHKDGLLPGIEQALSGLLPQLHIVSLEYNSIPMSNPDLLKKLDSITLFDAGIFGVNDTIPISYLRFELYGTKREFDSLTRSLQRASLSLPLTIYLPLFASPDQPDSL